MRAERLPDLVNQNQAKRRSTVETIVTATFDITDVADKLLSREEEEEKEEEVDEVEAAGNARTEQRQQQQQQQRQRQRQRQNGSC